MVRGDMWFFQLIENKPDDANAISDHLDMAANFQDALRGLR